MIKENRRLWAVLLFVSMMSCTALVVWPTAAQEVKVPRFFGEQDRFTSSDVENWRQLRFLTTIDFPPFNYIDETGHLAGYHIDLARAICVELHVENKCQIEAVPWAELTGRLPRGGEVVMAGLAPTAQNRMELAFSRPYMRFPARFIALKNAVLSQITEESLAERKVGLVRNTAHEKLFAAYFPTLSVTLFDDYAALYSALARQEIELGFGDGMRFSLWLGGGAEDGKSNECCAFTGDAYFAPAYLGEGMRLAVALQNGALADIFNHALHSLEQKGRLDELYLKYFPFGFY